MINLIIILGEAVTWAHFNPSQSLFFSKKNEKPVGGLGEMDVAVGHRTLQGLSSFSPKSGFQNENTLIRPLTDIDHWAIKFQSFYYEMGKDEQGFMCISRIDSRREKESFKWQVMELIVVEQEDVLKLIKEIKKKKLSQSLFSRNCQHFAAAIGNYAMALWDKQKVLSQIVK